jgi:copper chaperone CopZ
VEMMCGGCEAAVKRILSKMDGVNCSAQCCCNRQTFVVSHDAQTSMKNVMSISSSSGLMLVCCARLLSHTCGLPHFVFTCSHT